MSWKKSGRNCSSLHDCTSKTAQKHSCYKWIGSTSGKDLPPKRHHHHHVGVVTELFYLVHIPKRAQWKFFLLLCIPVQSCDPIKRTCLSLKNNTISNTLVCPCCPCCRKGGSCHENDAQTLTSSFKGFIWNISQRCLLDLALWFHLPNSLLSYDSFSTIVVLVPVQIPFCVGAFWVPGAQEAWEPIIMMRH